MQHAFHLNSAGRRRRARAVTIILPKFYHIRRALEESRVVCISAEQAVHQDIRPLRIGILNVMPMAETYEYTILQPLGRSILQIEPVWIRLKSHAYKTSNWEHIRSAYVTFDEAMQPQPLDGLLLTGAPVEELAFEEVHYWEELSPILSQARQQCASTLGLCWGGLALAKLIGIEKQSSSVNYSEYLVPGTSSGITPSREIPMTAFGVRKVAFPGSMTRSWNSSRLRETFACSRMLPRPATQFSKVVTDVS